MENRRLRIVISMLTGFIALTAIGGGLALLVGLEDARFPLEWLRDTPFKDYTIPALLLAVVVGGSALVACVAIMLRHGWGIPVSIAAGVIMMGYIVVEYLILKQSPPGPTVTEYVYFTLGLVTFVLAGYLWLAKRTPV